MSPEYFDNSFYFKELIREGQEKFEETLSGRLQQNGTDPENAALIATYRELEFASRETLPNYEALLVAAIIAGEKSLSVSSGSVWFEVHHGLVGLLVRCWRWDPDARMPDLDRAILHTREALNLAKGNSSQRAAVLKDLSNIYETQYGHTKDSAHFDLAVHYLEEAARSAPSPTNDTHWADAACLRFKRDPDSLKCILEIPMDALPSTPVTFANVDRKRFRFIDARSFAAGHSLRVLELNGLPKQRYATLSYVWRGSHRPELPSTPRGIMSIVGAVGADPISIDVLMMICKCTLVHSDLIWIDGVCIIQNDENDKAWQIQNMFDIYKECKECIIVPGGLSRLVPLTERTSWIHRAWTLQEAVIPQSCRCLFSWPHGNAFLQSHFPVEIKEVEPGLSASADLQQLLSLSMTATVKIRKIPTDSGEIEEEIKLRILGDNNESAQMAALVGAIDLRNQEGMATAIWRSSLMRVASRSADTVFSIMGLLGIVLNPLKFDAQNRVDPTIALMQALLRKGERAEWLGAAPRMEINEDIPTLPKFPKATSDGRVVADTAKGDTPIVEVMGVDSWWRLVGAPRGEMHDDGTLVLYARAIPIRRKQYEPTDVRLRADYLSSDDVPGKDASWYANPRENGPPFAIQIGKKERYVNAALAMLIDPEPFLLMLLEPTVSGKLRNSGYTCTSKETVQMEGWVEQAVTIEGKHG